MRAAVVLGLMLLISCARTDLGSPCHLLNSNNTEVQPVPHETIVQSGNGECQQFACVSFNGAPAICSQPCTKEGESCGSGLVCRASMLTPDLLTSMRARTAGTDQNHNGVDDYEELTGGLSDSLYCGPSG